MAKKATRPTATGKPRMSDDDVRSQGFNPFIRPEHVKEGQALKLTGFNRKKDIGTPREQIVCEVETAAGDTFDLGVRTGSPDHRVLHRALGSDWEKWHGAVIVTIRQRDTVAFVNIASAEPDEPPF